MASLIEPSNSSSKKADGMRCPLLPAPIDLEMKGEPSDDMTDGICPAEPRSDSSHIVKVQGRPAVFILAKQGDASGEIVAHSGEGVEAGHTAIRDAGSTRGGSR